MFRILLCLALWCVPVAAEGLSDKNFETLRQELRSQYLQDPQKAILLCDNALAQQPLNTTQRIKVLNYKAWFQLETNALAASMHTIADIKHLLRSVDDPRLTYVYYNLSGGVFAKLGMDELALENYQQALKISEQMNEAMFYQTRNNIAAVHLALGQHKQALDAYLGYLQYLDKRVKSQGQDEHLSRSLVLINITKTYLAEQQFAKAKQFLQQAIALQQQHQFTYHLAYSAQLTGRLALLEHDYNTAYQQLQAALETLQAQGNKQEVDDVKLDLISYYRANHKLTAALQLLHEVLDSASSRDDKRLLIKALALQSQLLEEQGQYQAAVGSLRRYNQIERQLLQQQNRVALARTSHELELTEKDLQIDALQQENRLQEAKADTKIKLLATLLMFIVIYIASSSVAIVQIRRKKRHLVEALQKLQNTQLQLLEAEKMSALAAMVSGMAHHLNTPTGLIITANSAFANNLRDIETQLQQKTLTPQVLRQFLAHGQAGVAIVERSAQRLSTMVERFKAINLTIKGAQLIRIDLSAFLNLHVREIAGRFDRQVTLTLPQQAFFVETYPSLLHEILLELIQNSMQHGLQDIAKPHIQIELSTLPNAWRLTYGDNGTGISELACGQVFIPFYGTNLSQQLGLGLSIVNNTVLHVLGGKIECIYSPNGAIFELTVPTTILQPVTKSQAVTHE
ncbi:ATP-binding protein [Pseudoalteromonas fenneropenaei]|uniref:ATP-binding protein n=1 Tax=Pseudoalteromonas fenneropenaei TaxID=1737459 RepID=A0ABV7CMY7_9GAMM